MAKPKFEKTCPWHPWLFNHVSNTKTISMGTYKARLVEVSNCTSAKNSKAHICLNSCTSSIVIWWLVVVPYLPNTCHQDLGFEKLTQLITFADISGHCSIITKCPHIGQQWSLMFMLLNCGAMNMAIEHGKWTWVINVLVTFQP